MHALLLLTVLATASPAAAPVAKPGDVASVRAFTGGIALASAARNLFVLYHERTVEGRDVLVSGTIAIPKGTPPPGGWPVISWAHGTTGNAPSCAPSQQHKMNVEQKILDQWVQHGYVVVQTDYEGEGKGTPIVHPYFVAKAAARDVADIVRAARQIDPGIGPRWAVMGHSEGGTAAISAAAYAQAWAPELKLVGSVAFAPASEIAPFMDGMRHSTEPTSAFVLFFMMVAGIGSSDPAIHLDSLLSPLGRQLLAQLQQQCVDELMNDNAWDTIEPEAMWAPGANTAPLTKDFFDNEPGMMKLTVPLLLVQGSADTMVSPAATQALHDEFCGQGDLVRLDSIAGANHGTVLAQGAAAALRWTDALFHGGRVGSDCPH